MTTEAHSVESLVVTMTRSLRDLGVPAPPDSTLAFAAALAEVGIAQRSAVYWAGRATLVHRPEDVAAYDSVFAATFDGDVRLPARPASQVEQDVPVLVGADAGTRVQGEPGREPVEAVRWSDQEVLAGKDFAACTD
ncbi:MAG TPA: hypothetical protein VIR58_06695, partial [Acidimicrobiales bacterium]